MPKQNDSTTSQPFQTLNRWQKSQSIDLLKKRPKKCGFLSNTDMMDVKKLIANLRNKTSAKGRADATTSHSSQRPIPSNEYHALIRSLRTIRSAYTTKASCSRNDQTGIAFAIESDPNFGKAMKTTLTIPSNKQE
jgi:hypothetical protein